MKKVILFAVAASLISCEFSLNREDDQTDINYPTTIHRLPEKALLQKRNDFAQRNPNVYTSLNHFGFCDMLDPGGGNGSPGGFTEEEAIAAVMEFVKRNPEYTGVSNPNDLKFKTINSDIGYNNAVFWFFRTEYQIINKIEVVYSEILFHTQTSSLISCYGNHFPKVYVPEKFNFDVERAKSQLLGREAFHYTIAGEKYSFGKVKAQHLQECLANLIIVPIRTEEKIELRVAWQINVDTMHYIYCIDVMTGEIIQETPTIIS